MVLLTATEENNTFLLEETLYKYERVFAAIWSNLGRRGEVRHASY